MMTFYKAENKLFSNEQEAYDYCLGRITNHRECCKEFKEIVTSISVKKKDNRTIFIFKYKSKPDSSYLWHQTSIGYTKITVD